jgi:hypothetical protein
MFGSTHSVTASQTKGLQSHIKFLECSWWICKITALRYRTNFCIKFCAANLVALRLCHAVRSHWFSCKIPHHTFDESASRDGLTLPFSLFYNMLEDDSYTTMKRMASNNSRWKAANQSKDWRIRRRNSCKQADRLVWWISSQRALHQDRCLMLGLHGAVCSQFWYISAQGTVQQLRSSLASRQTCNMRLMVSRRPHSVSAFMTTGVICYCQVII